MRTENAPLSDLLFGRTRGRLLATLYERPESAFFVRQLARHIHGSVGTVQRELATLTGAGLILRNDRESQVFYRANDKHPVFSELRSLLMKTTGLVPALREALKPIAGDIEFAFIYGSFARGQEHSGSDIDLMVSGAATFDDLLDRVSPLEKDLGRPINPNIYTSEELREKLHMGNHFLKAIQKAPLIGLIGDENEFRAIR